MQQSIKFLVFLLTSISFFFNVQKVLAVPEIDPVMFGARGDGITDDSTAIQKALTKCSNEGLTCKVPAGKTFLTTKPLYIWGAADLKGDTKAGNIVFNVTESPYLLNVGISGRNQLRAPFSGSISQVKFTVAGGEGGRILYFWRTNGAQITNNLFEVGSYAYSATSSGNDNRVVISGFANCIRKNVLISGNEIRASGKNIGSEGIGLGHFDGAIIENNTVSGVGDDPIGIHFSKNIKILYNHLASVDGRIYVVNSQNVEIAHNHHERMAAVADNKFYPGISLIYIGFETLDANEFAAPNNISIHDNYLYYPENSVDKGAAIYLYGTRNTTVKNNQIVNDASASSATAVHILPAKFTGQWKDPDKIDPPDTANVWDTNVISNKSEGKKPLEIIMTGYCSEYKGKVVIQDNTAENFKFYCDSASLRDNKSLNTRPAPPKVNVLP